MHLLQIVLGTVLGLLVGPHGLLTSVLGLLGGLGLGL